MKVTTLAVDARRYARCIEDSQRVRWDIERDLIRGRALDAGSKFLPDGLARIDAFDFLAPHEQSLASRVQARSYAAMFGMFERHLRTRLLHQALFRRLEAMMAACMPAGYRFVPDPGAVAGLVLSRSAWSVLALSCLIELFTQAHYRQSVAPDAQLDPLWKDALLFHAKERSGHADVGELEWRREDATLDTAARDRAVGDLIVLFGALDGILQAQARADAAYFAAARGRDLEPGERDRVVAAFLYAYRWQYLLCGVQVPHFSALLGGMLGSEQHGRIAAALAPLFDGSALPEVRAG